MQRAAPYHLVLGGLVAAVLFLPFTQAHGPTSVNLEREVLGWDMHRWGLVMGTIPEVLLSAGVWLRRAVLAGGSRVARAALVTACAAMLLFAAMNLAFRAIGPPFDLVVLAPAMVVAAATSRTGGAVRVVLAALAATYCLGLVLGVAVPADAALLGTGGFRLFGLTTYAGTGLLWAVLGLVLLRRRAD